MAASLVKVNHRGTHPVTLAEVKEYLRVTDTAQDDTINALILAATDYAETFTGLQIRPQQYLLTLDHFPYGYSCSYGLSRCCDDVSANFAESPYYDGSNIILPRGPIFNPDDTSDLTVSYTNTSGGTTSLVFGTDYLADETSVPPRLYLPYNETWPTNVRAIQGAVQIYFTAGFDAAKGSDESWGLPDGIRQAIKILVNHWYEAREPIVIGASVVQVPMSVESLLWQHRIVSLN